MKGHQGVLEILFKAFQRGNLILICLSSTSRRNVSFTSFEIADRWSKRLPLLPMGFPVGWGGGEKQGCALCLGAAPAALSCLGWKVSRRQQQPRDEQELVDTHDVAVSASDPRMSKKPFWSRSKAVLPRAAERSERYVSTTGPWGSMYCMSNAGQTPASSAENRTGASINRRETQN